MAMGFTESLSRRYWLSISLCFSSLLISGVAFSFTIIPESCPEWFENADVKPGIACVYNCVLIPTDIFTNTCPLFCASLCERDYAGVAFFKITDLYPGLTLTERGFVVDSPREAMIAYSYSWRAESTCDTKYFASGRNDESDACRHFIWAALLTQRLGSQKAKKILDAHEDNPAEPTAERAMDMANNRAGILSCERLMESGGCNDKNELTEFQTELRAGKIIVLKQRHRGQ